MVPILLKKTADSGSIDESAHVAGQTAAAILAHVAKKCPLVFKGFEVELLHALSEENHPDTVQAALLAASELKRVDALAFKEQPWVWSCMQSQRHMLMSSSQTIRRKGL